MNVSFCIVSISRILSISFKVNIFFCMMSENNSVYENLKKEIIRKAGNTFDFQTIKNFFSCVIDSRRSLSKLKDLGGIFHLLEERDALDSNNVSALLIIGNLLSNNDIINLVCGYKKLHIEDENCVCICGNDRAFILPIVPKRDSSENEHDDLETAIKNVAKNIGKKWRCLASELKVRECHIDEIREKYPNDMCQQALKSLQIWRNYNKDTASVDILKSALDSRLCKMKGIGSHMLSPIISVD